jgi:hypothetical protein
VRFVQSVFQIHKIHLKNLRFRVSRRRFNSEFAPIFGFQSKGESNRKGIRRESKKTVFFEPSFSSIERKSNAFNYSCIYRREERGGAF